MDRSDGWSDGYSFTPGPLLLCRRGVSFPNESQSVVSGLMLDGSVALSVVRDCPDGSSPRPRLPHVSGEGSARPSREEGVGGRPSTTPSPFLTTFLETGSRRHTGVGSTNWSV